MSELAVALAGDDGTVRDAVEAVGGAVVPAAEADALVTLGEAALVDAALSEPAVPLLAVGADGGLHSVSSREVGRALDALEAGSVRRTSHDVLSVAVGGERVARGLLDVSLMTDGPAHISEYSVRAGGDEIDRFRADGVVVATPAGSSGYARAAGGPVLGPGAGLSVVPVSAFETNPDTWVLDDDVGLVVERDDSAIDLVVDGSVVASVPVRTPVEVVPDGSVDLLRVPKVASSG
ncbi:hypothetical protein [Halorarum halobium]|uniref:hypothetical protein n=1 Tax=Halorarum halobium TaxID=3075121 RepID=UPI0028AB0446|nr:hypothetical protein [Halobaculum sp. XH14]